MDIQTLLGSYSAYLTFPIVLIVAVVAGFFAFNGYSIFKKCLSLFGAIAFGVVGSSIIAPIIPLELPFINFNALVGIVLAVVGAILMIYVYKLAIFVIGAAGGYFVAQLFIAPLFELQGTVALVVSIVAAVILGIIALLLFKPLFIISSSVLSLTVVGALASYVVFAEANMIITIVCAVIGLVIGIIAAVKQFQEHAGQP